MKIRLPRGHERLRIGVVGYSAAKFNVGLAEKYLRQALSPFSDGSEIELISGLTDIGIPALAYRIADEYGWKTMGIACVKATECQCYLVDRRQIVGDEWGDESRTFLSQIDILVRVGGGKQSISEEAEARKLNIQVISYELPLSENV